MDNSSLPVLRYTIQLTSEEHAMLVDFVREGEKAMAPHLAHGRIYCQEYREAVPEMLNKVRGCQPDRDWEDLPRREGS